MISPQQQLFADAPPREAPIARRSDPATSRIAGDELTASGERAAQKAAVLTWLRGQHEALTSREIAVAGGFDRYMVARRLPDLEHDGAAKKVGARACQISGKACVTWRAVE